MKLVILDRDGVINADSPDYIKRPDEWHPIPGSLKAIARLNRAGIRVMVATNQSGIARGLFDYDALFAIHAKMADALNVVGGHLDGIVFCPHGPDEGCDCRKPKPGLLNEIRDRTQIDLAGVPFVGDSWRDVQAAQAAGAVPVLVKTGNGEKTLAEHPDAGIDVFGDLGAAVEAWLGDG